MHEEYVESLVGWVTLRIEYFSKTSFKQFDANNKNEWKT